MKSSLLSLVSIVGVFALLLALPWSAVATLGNVLLLVGIAAVFVTAYGGSAALFGATRPVAAARVRASALTRTAAAV
jgi:flagellar motor component MotA